MDEKSAAKVADFSTEALSLIEQIQQVIRSEGGADASTMLMFENYLKPKFNEKALKIYIRRKKNRGLTSHGLRHCLKLKDLKNVIIDARDEMREIEFNNFFDGREKENTNTKENGKKHKSETSGEKDSAMRDAFSFMTEHNPKGGANEKSDRCPVPGCKSKFPMR